MALDTYAALQAAVANWMHRSNMTGDIPDFVTLAEVRIKSLLTTRLQSVTAALPTVSGQGYITAPADLLHVRSLSIPDMRPAVKYVTPDQFSADFADQRSGMPYSYTIIGSQINLGPVPDAIYAASLVYEAKFLPLSNAAPSNALLANWPNVYLWGTLKEAAMFARDFALEQEYNAAFLEAVEAANKLEWHSGGPMRMRTDTYTP